MKFPGFFALAAAQGCTKIHFSSGGSNDQVRPTIRFVTSKMGDGFSFS
jgi:hypothetical protein